MSTPAKGKRNLPSIHKAKFLAAYSQLGNITAAAKISQVARSLHYEWMSGDPEYAQRFAVATDEAVERLEAEARRRAEKGCLKPVYQGGKKVGTIREYSDTLLIFLLKGARPDRYRDNARVEHSGPAGGPLTVEVVFRKAA